VLGSEPVTGTIQTFGYEGLAIADFVSRLKSSGTTIVIDVRANPLSRKPGFSKTAFANNLAAAEIGYVHVSKMGCPKGVRDRYKADGDWAAYTTGFHAHLAGQHEAVIEVAKIAMQDICCLVCFEADYNCCHRTFVARAAAAVMPLRIVHLTNRGSVAERALVRSAA
jgi:uncharacterized protein (DUF488 family)